MPSVPHPPLLVSLVLAAVQLLACLVGLVLIRRAVRRALRDDYRHCDRTPAPW